MNENLDLRLTIFSHRIQLEPQEDSQQPATGIAVFYSEGRKLICTCRHLEFSATGFDPDLGMRHTNPGASINQNPLAQVMDRYEVS